MILKPQLRLCLIVCLAVLLKFSVGGVIEATYNNLEKVLASYEEIYLLFHNPQCSHSREYREKFLDIQNVQGSEFDIKLGIVDCLRELKLCNKYSYTSFPQLVKFSVQQSTHNSSANSTSPQIDTQVLNEYQFLADHGTENPQSDKVVHKKMTQFLDSDPRFIVLIQEQEGLPVESKNRISTAFEHSGRVFYIQPSTRQNPSQLSQSIFHLLNGKEGCWVLHYNQAERKFEHFYCGEGHNPSALEKHITNFLAGHLNPYIFQAEQESLRNGEINTEGLNEVQSKVQEDNRCRAVYIYSENCLSCSKRDLHAIKRVIQRIQAQEKIILNHFSLDQNQLSEKVKKLLNRVPQLFIQCSHGSKMFGQVFFQKNLEKFLSQSLSGNFENHSQGPFLADEEVLDL